MIQLAGGMTVDVPSQALPVGSKVTVEEIAPLDLPEDITSLGPAYRIEAAEEPAEPVALQIPLPEGEDPEGIAIVHVHDGDVDLTGGQVIQGVFHTAVSSFSEVQLVKVRIDEIFGIAGVPAVDLDLEGTDGETGPFAVEHGQLVTGERSEPAPRVVSIVGPSEIAVGQLAVFTAAGFAAEHPGFVEYQWRVSGRNEAGVPSEGLAEQQMFLTVMRAGRYTVMLDARDPVTGAEAFAALTVFADEEAFTVVASPPINVDGQPEVGVSVVNGVGSVELLWAFTPGPGGRSTISSPGEPAEPGAVTIYGPIFFGPGVAPLQQDLIFEVFAEDAGDATSYASIVLTASDNGRPRGAIVGPTSVEVGQAATFTALTDNVEGLTLVWDTQPGVETSLAGNSVTAVWEEPGIGLVRLFALVEDNEGPIPVPLDVVAVAATTPDGQVDSGATTQDATQDPGSISGAVLETETGDPIAGAAVSVVPTGSSTITDGAGQFTLAEVPAGAQTISVTADGYGETTVQVDVEPDETTPVTVTLDPTDPAAAVIGQWNASGIWKQGGGWVNGTMTLTADGGVTFGWGETWGDGTEFTRTGSGTWSISGDTLTTVLGMFAAEMVYEGVYAGTVAPDASVIVLLSGDWNFTLSR